MRSLARPGWLDIFFRRDNVPLIGARRAHDRLPFLAGLEGGRMKIFAPDLLYLIDSSF